MGRRSGAQRAKSQYYTSDLSLPARASAMPASAACLSCGRTLLTAVFALASLVVLSGDNALAQGSVAGDRLALVALYNATDGANWTNNTNWLTNEAISEWHGVVTDGEGRVKRLLLGHNEVHPVNGEVPPVKGRPWKLPHYANRGKTSSSGGELASARSCFSTVRTALGKLRITGLLARFDVARSFPQFPRPLLLQPTIWTSERGADLGSGRCQPRPHLPIYRMTPQ